jgi:hypothetical protein
MRTCLRPILVLFLVCATTLLLETRGAAAPLGPCEDGCNFWFEQCQTDVTDAYSYCSWEVDQAYQQCMTVAEFSFLMCISLYPFDACNFQYEQDMAACQFERYGYQQGCDNQYSLGMTYCYTDLEFCYSGC